MGSTAASRSHAGTRRLSLPGGTDGNEQLTSITGVLLILLLAVLGVTILRIGQLIWLHLFLGLLLIGPVALKMATTGYRFARYYTGDRIYRQKGPPPPALRLLAPGVVLSTMIVFISGIVLLFAGPAARDTPLLIHKASFIVWGVLTALHVLGHLPGLGSTVRKAAVVREGVGVPGGSGRWLAVVGALVAGLVLAVVLIPDFHIWTATGAFPHHFHDRH
jgi:hypothetical protein